MKNIYTVELDSAAHAAVRSLLKDAVKDETTFINIARQHLEEQPAMRPVVEHAYRQRDIYARVYDMLTTPAPSEGTSHESI